MARESAIYLGVGDGTDLDLYEAHTSTSGASTMKIKRDYSGEVYSYADKLHNMLALNDGVFIYLTLKERRPVLRTHIEVVKVAESVLSEDETHYTLSIERVDISYHAPEDVNMGNWTWEPGKVSIFNSISTETMNQLHATNDPDSSTQRVDVLGGMYYGNPMIYYYYHPITGDEPHVLFRSLYDSSVFIDHRVYFPTSEPIVVEASTELPAPDDGDVFDRAKTKFFGAFNLGNAPRDGIDMNWRVSENFPGIYVQVLDETDYGTFTASMAPIVNHNAMQFLSKQGGSTFVWYTYEAPTLTVETDEPITINLMMNRHPYEDTANNNNIFQLGNRYSEARMLIFVDNSTNAAEGQITLNMGSYGMLYWQNSCYDISGIQTASGNITQVANFASLPATGSPHELYQTIDNNYFYKWYSAIGEYRHTHYQNIPRVFANHDKYDMGSGLVDVVNFAPELPQGYSQIVVSFKTIPNEVTPPQSVLASWEIYSFFS